VDSSVQDNERYADSTRRAKEETESIPDIGDSSEIAEETLARLKKVLGAIDEREFIAFYVTRRYSSPILTLIATILSQNTNEKNAFKAWFNLLNKVNGKVEEICKLSLDEIKEAIRPAGLFEGKARAIKEVCNRRDEIVEAILKGNPKPLLKIKGIGKKTADVVLLNFGHPTFPVDTHILRVSKRLGWGDGTYDGTSRKLGEIFKGRELEAHMYLILFGRRICKSRKPLCNVCPLRDMCKSREKVEVL